MESFNCKDYVHDRIVKGYPVKYNPYTSKDDTSVPGVRFFKDFNCKGPYFEYVQTDAKGTKITIPSIRHQGWTGSTTGHGKTTLTKPGNNDPWGNPKRIIHSGESIENRISSVAIPPYMVWGGANTSYCEDYGHKDHNDWYCDVRKNLERHNEGDNKYNDGKNQKTIYEHHKWAWVKPGNTKYKSDPDMSNSDGTYWWDGYTWGIGYNHDAGELNNLETMLYKSAYGAKRKVNDSLDQLSQNAVTYPYTGWKGFKGFVTSCCFMKDTDRQYGVNADSCGPYWGKSNSGYCDNIAKDHCAKLIEKAKKENKPIPVECSCYVPPLKVDGEPGCTQIDPRCHSSACMSGAGANNTAVYYPTNFRNTNASCTSCTICKQNFDTAGINNTYDNVKLTQNCGNETTTTTANTNNTGGVTITETKHPLIPEPKPDESSNTMLYIIIAFVVLIVLGIGIFMLDDEDEYDEYPQYYPQQYYQYAQ